MVTFGEITRRDLGINYTKEDISGYKVAGSVSYNKDNEVISAEGRILTTDDVHLGSFNVHGTGDAANISCNCPLKHFAEVQGVAAKTYADLAKSTPKA